jgi:ElaB/YqjD/DUF883 family membrane-anchored ribosome-binding protein
MHALRIIDGEEITMAGDHKRSDLDRMLEAFLEAEAEQRRDGITLRLLAGHVDEVRQEAVENKRWRTEHEDRDDERHREMSRRLDRIEERVEQRLATVTTDLDELAEKTGKFQVVALEAQLEEARTKARDLEARLETAKQRNSDHVRESVAKVADRAIENVTFWQRYGVAVIVGIVMLVAGACTSGGIGIVLKLVK